MIIARLKVVIVRWWSAIIEKLLLDRSSNPFFSNPLAFTRGFTEEKETKVASFRVILFIFLFESKTISVVYGKKSVAACPKQLIHLSLFSYWFDLESFIKFINTHNDDNQSHANKRRIKESHVFFQCSRVA